MPHRASSGAARLALSVPLALLLAGAMAPAAGAQGVLTLESAPPRPEGPMASQSPGAPSDPQAALLAVAECMREHGVDMPDPEFAGDGSLRIRLLGTVATIQGDPDFEAAREACSPALAAVTRDVDPARMLALQEQLLAYAGCMREHGVDMPDPQVAGAAPAALPRWDPADAVAQAAHDACGGVIGGPAPASEPFEGAGPSSSPMTTGPEPTR